ncbi:aminoglycoside phosphotransferase [Streptomyces sp. NBC_00201]|uniref:aminoglycoside phosphotransferase n=1 Tax=unclassified Streptomyces TaxID=2593676 RepID=UPI0022537F9C|nr:MULTISPECIES: aminoglycoside phosphotransferase [unclassified Streptomyces]MCX5250625.1 aminoglycoside phosphotransferase [Streptomyces sp. NBC_00201]MCX5291446.1 aminoglycoside phosphotransferase [Streptomyces sp. NBC_00183]
MPTERLHDLPADVLALIESQAGPVLKHETAGSGLNSEIAARIHTAEQTMFIKGLRESHRRVWTQQAEADVNPHVRGIAPALLWRIQADGWDLLAFEDVSGRHADYTPGSPDLELVADLIGRLSATPAPDTVTRTMPDRMKAHTNTPELFAGDSLCHTDWFPTNVLITDRAVLVDWAWASRGAAWIDSALWVVWLINSGHTAAQAEHWAARIPAWQAAPAASIDAFAAATLSVWEQIADGETEPWVINMLNAARTWSAHR